MGCSTGHGLIFMNSQDILRIQQVEASIQPFRSLLDRKPPHGGWVRAIREALGMTHAQLGHRAGKAQQTIEGMQRSEAAGTIQLGTLRQLAEAMGCQLVYAVVPVRPIEEMRRERAVALAREMLQRTSHSMKLEDQAVGDDAERRTLERLITQLLAGNPRRLWDQS